MLWELSLKDLMIFFCVSLILLVQCQIVKYLSVFCFLLSTSRHVHNQGKNWKVSIKFNCIIIIFVLLAKIKTKKILICKLFIYTVYKTGDIFVKLLLHIYIYIKKKKTLSSEESIYGFELFHPAPYSPDLAPFDYYMFSNMKKHRGLGTSIALMISYLLLKTFLTNRM